MDTFKNLIGYVSKAKSPSLLHGLSLFNDDNDSSSSSLSSTVHRKDTEDQKQWAQKAIEHVVKKIRKEGGKLDDLEFAVSNPHARSKCVTIPRSMDGRLQVSHKKGLPHVIYCTVWRWKDLTSHHELRPVSYCQYPFQTAKQQQQHQQQQQQQQQSVLGFGCASQSSAMSAIADQGEVCINPYHYERIETSPMQPIFVPRNPHMGSRWHPYMNPHAANSHGNGFHSLPPPHSFHNNGNLYLLTDQMPPPIMPPPIKTEAPGGENFFATAASPPSPSDRIAAVGNFSLAGGPFAHNFATNVCSPAPSFISINAPNSPYCNGMPDSPQQQLLAQQTNNGMDVDMDATYQQQQQLRHHSFDSLPASPLLHHAAPAGVTAVPYMREKFWCKIRYYELQKTVGQPFFGAHAVATVDGFPGGDACRFGLGNYFSSGHNKVDGDSDNGIISVSNSSQELLDDTRRRLLKGIQLSYVDRRVQLENLAIGNEGSVFVQSRLLNRRLNPPNPDGKCDDTTVIKIPPGCTVEIFNLSDFAELLRHKVNEGYEECWKLGHMCTIRLSFVKGWGADYPGRHHITACPCWLEITLQEPQEWLSRVLNQMDSPQTRISSQS